jgi:hypothetical protein
MGTVMAAAKPTAAPVIPTADDANVRLAGLEALRKRQKTMSRSSTNMGPALGDAPMGDTGPYSSTVLG